MTQIFDNFNTKPYVASTPTQQPSTQKIQVEEALAATKVSGEDKVELTTNGQKKEKKGFIKSIKGMIAGVKKFFAAAGAYTKGTFKGIGTGIVSGSILYTAGDILNNTMLKNKKKCHNKAIAIGAAAISLAGHLWHASLDATERQSKIDHRWTGHD